MDVKFHITSDGWLDRFTCTACKKEIDEFVIPAKVDGKEVWSIEQLTRSFSKLKDHGVRRIKKIKIEEGVREAQAWAFAGIGIEIDEMLWPSSCDKIPVSCFYATPLEEIKGIDNIKKIGKSAFACTNLKTITWPSDCEKIPEGCFYNTPLKEIHNLDLAKEIGEYAFARTNLKTITWPVNCDRIPVNCFRGSTTEEIKFPAGGIMDIDLYKLAFTFRNIKKIDLSALGVVNFIKGCPGVDYQKLYEGMKDILCLPYYVSGLE